MQKSGEDKIFLPLVGNSGTKYFFQHDDLKLSAKSCVGSVPCVTLLLLEVFGPEKKRNGQRN